MKRSIILFAMALTMFSGCSSRFKHYTPSSEKEKATTSYQSIRLLNSENKSKIVMSAVYLNDVYPNYADDDAHFLIAFYCPDQESTLYFDRNQTSSRQDYVLLLNGSAAVASEALESDDLLIDLMPSKNSWNRYYYVRYKLPSATPVLVLESDRTELAAITYQKEQE